MRQVEGFGGRHSGWSGGSYRRVFAVHSGIEGLLVYPEGRLVFEPGVVLELDESVTLETALVVRGRWRRLGRRLWWVRQTYLPSWAGVRLSPAKSSWNIIGGAATALLIHPLAVATLAAPHSAQSTLAALASESPIRMSGLLVEDMRDQLRVEDGRARRGTVDRPVSDHH